MSDHLTDDDLYPTGHTVDLPVPLAAIVEASGAELDTGGGVMVYRPASLAVPVKPLPLRLGDHDLGLWILVGAEYSMRRNHPTEYIATLRKVDRP